MQYCNDAQMSVACILPKQKIFCSLVLLIKLLCQFSITNDVCGCNYTDTASSNQEIDYFGF